jgi:hypothetical protein
MAPPNMLHSAMALSYRWKPTGGCNSHTASMDLSVTHANTFITKVIVILRPTVSRPVYPGIRPPSGNHDEFFFLSTKSIFRYLNFFFNIGRPLLGEDGSVIYSYKRSWVLPALSLSGTKSRRTWDDILLSHLRLGSLSVASYDSQDYGGIILIGLHTGYL